MSPPATHAARQEARAHKRLHGYLESLDARSNICTRAVAIQAALDKRPVPKARKGAQRPSAGGGAEEEASAALLLALFEGGTKRDIEARIDELACAEREALKVAYWRAMHRWRTPTHLSSCQPLRLAVTRVSDRPQPMVHNVALCVMRRAGSCLQPRTSTR